MPIPREFAAAISNLAVQGYEDGEIDLRETLRWVESCARDCTAVERRVLLGLTVERALKTTPHKLKHKKPKYARCLKASVATLVIMHGEKRLPVTPFSKDENDAISQALKMLEPLDLCRDLPAHKTVYKWYLEYKHYGGIPSSEP